MPGGRPSYDLKQYQEQFKGWIKAGYSQPQILSLFNAQYGWRPNQRTLQRRFQAWGLQQYVRQAVLMTNELKEEVVFNFYQLNNSDSAILQKLCTKGHEISLRQLRSVRKELGLKRRTDTLEGKQQQIIQCREFLAKEFAQSARLAELGRGYLHDYAKEQGQQFSRDILFEVYKEFRPEATLRFHVQKRRQKGEFIVYGPNQVISIDGHDKLKHFGIHIYGGIDGYSRYMVWCHVGFYGSTSISTLKQYLRVVRKLGYIPRVIRADRGKEVPLLAAAHWVLVREGYTNQDGSPVEFGDCFYYGRSMDNTRIEQWWGQLLKSCLSRWILVFKRMEYKRLWIAHDPACEIAFLAVYMPVIRREVDLFVQRWNKHKVRGQTNRANSVDGRPYENYFTPNPAIASQWGLPANIDLLAEVEDLISDANIDEYLPDQTYRWCEDALSSYGLDRTKEDDEEFPFTSFYNHLRSAINIEFTNGNLSGLQRPSGPMTGGIGKLKEKFAVIGKFPSVQKMEAAVRNAHENKQHEEEFNFDNAAPDVKLEELIEGMKQEDLD